MSEDEKDFNFVVVNDNLRTHFNNQYFRDVLFDLRIFNIADQVLVGYKGGYWEYMLWKNTVPFFNLRGEERITLRNPHSGESYEMNGTLAGMVITLYALNFELEKRPNEKGADQLFALTDLIYEYAAEIGEFNQAYKMID